MKESIENERLDYTLKLIFDDDDIRNSWGCGMGKTHTTMDYVQSSNESFLIVVPSHLLASEISEKWGFTHIKGKEMEEENPHYNFYNCYISGCNKCKHRDSCPYLEQDFDARVCVAPFGMIRTLNDKDNLVIEEDPSQVVFNHMELKESDMEYIELGDPHYREKWGGEYKFYPVSLYVEDESPSNKHEFKLFNFKWCDKLVVHEYKGRKFLHGYKPINNWAFNRTIFNCATTPLSYQKFLFRKDIDNLVTESRKIENPIISIRGSWGVHESSSKLDSIRQFILNLKLGLQIDGKDGNIFMATKKKYESKFSDVCDTIHYGLGRGFNKYNEDYDLAVMFGAFHYDPISICVLEEFGISESTIRELENAEIIQSLHRCRPFIHKSTPIILLTNRVYENFKWTEISGTTIDSFNRFPLRHEDQYSNKELEDEGLSQYSAFNLNTFARFLRMFVYKHKSKLQVIKEAVAKGYPVSKLADKMDVSSSTIYRWLNCEILTPEQERKVYLNENKEEDSN